MKKILLCVAICVLSLVSHAKPRDNSSFIVYDTRNNQIVDGQNIDEVRSIASITKLMSAVVYLNKHFDGLDTKLLLSNSTKSRLPVREYTRRELLIAMLVLSDNAAAETLAADYDGGRTAFIRDMNEQARQLHMSDTTFIDPSGLGIFNRSTVRDITILLQHAYANDTIRLYSSYVGGSFTYRNSRNRERKFEFQHTNLQLIKTNYNIQLSKTGYTNAAGYCVAMIVNNNGNQYAVVLLGQRSKITRFKQATWLLSKYTKG